MPREQLDTSEHFGEVTRPQMSCIPGLDWGTWALGCRAGRRAGKRPACINAGPHQGNALSRQWDRSPCGASTSLNPRPKGLSRGAWGPSDVGGGGRHPPQKPSNSGPHLEGPRSQGGGSSGRDGRLELRPCARSLLCPFVRSFTRPSAQRAPGAGVMLEAVVLPARVGLPAPRSGQREGTGDSGLRTCSGHTRRAQRVCRRAHPGKARAGRHLSILPAPSRPWGAVMSLPSPHPSILPAPSRPWGAVVSSPGLSGCFPSLPTPATWAPSTCRCICQPCFALPTPLHSTPGQPRRPSAKRSPDSRPESPALGTIFRA